ncbi:MAG: trypsin-like serine protease [Deltaproteobacteria bacterium]|nr:trypsin-like serine protease [Deltaproteobacteria bacterium]
MRRPSWLVFALLLSACEPAPTFSSVDRTAPLPIIGGSLDSGDPAVPLIILQDTAGNMVGICTGTLITPRVVLTAAHCMDSESNATRWTAYFGNSIQGYYYPSSDPGYKGKRTVTKAEHHPSWDPAKDPGQPYDIALMLLGSDAPVSPKPMNRLTIDASYVGQPVRLVGFGDTRVSSQESGRKRQVTVPLSDLDSLMIVYGNAEKNVCQGDSGGPNFMTINGTEYVVGVTSFGDPECKQIGVGGRTDAYAPAFIDPWIRQNDRAGCTADGACATSCNSPDPDCPCAKDGMCTTMCPDSNYDDDCPRGCHANGKCVEGCPRPDPDCSSSGTPDAGTIERNHCEADGTCQDGCLPRDTDCPAAGTGDACGEASECISGICLPAPDDPSVKYCTAFCDAEGETCPTGMSCVAVEGGRKACIWERAPGGVGTACTDPDQCASGICLPLGGKSFCTALCTPSQDACPSDFECAATTNGPHACIPADDEPRGGCALVLGRRPPSGTWRALFMLALVALGAAFRRHRR